jgi:hypothetical protein
MKKLVLILALLAGASTIFAADAANDVLLNQRNGANDDNLQRNVTATANSVFVFNGSLVPVSTDALTLASVTANASGGLLLKNLAGTTVMTVGPGSGTGVAFNSSGLTSVNSATAASGSALTFAGGDNGAGLVLGAGTSGVATISNAAQKIARFTSTFATTGSFVEYYDGANSAARGYVGWGTSLGMGNIANFGITATGNLYLGSNVGTNNAVYTSTGNLLIGTTTDAASLAGGLVLNGSGAGATSSSTTTGTLRVTGGAGISGNINAGGTITGASLATAQTPSASVATASTHKVAIVLNGVTYYMLLTNVP